MITIQVDGVKYQGFYNVTVEKSIDTICGTFSFGATQKVGDTFSFKRGQKVAIFIDNFQIIGGYINKISIAYTAKEHKIEIIGRDKTQDLVDSHLPENFKFNGPTSFSKIISETIKRLGIKNLSVVNDVEDLPLFTESDYINGKQGQTAFEFLETYARQLNVILSSDADGNVLITRASKISSKGALRLQKNSDSNNILFAQVLYDDTNRYNKYVSKSQENIAGSLAENDPDSAFSVNQSGSAIDAEIREGRVFTLIAESALDNDSNFNRAAWEANLRRANSIKYVANVTGFFADAQNTELWQINRLVKVTDVIAGINSIMLINAVSYTTDLTNGNMTRLELITPDAYELQVELQNKQKLASNLGAEYNDDITD